MSDLLILGPDIPQRATRFNAANSFYSAGNELTDYPAANTMRGPRWWRWQSSSDSTSHVLQYDMGPGNTRACDFVIYSRLDALRASASTIQMQILDSNDYDFTAFTVVDSVADIDVPTLYNNDYISLFTQTAGFRYWRMAMTTGGAAFANNIGKIYFGQRFDMGPDVDDYSIERSSPKLARAGTSAGSLFIGRSDFPRYEYEIIWEGVTNAKVATFFTDFVEKRYTTTFFLYTQNYHDILNNNRLLHVALMDAKTSNPDEKEDYNKLTTRWVEVVG